MIFDGNYWYEMEMKENRSKAKQHIEKLVAIFSETKTDVMFE